MLKGNAINTPHASTSVTPAREPGSKDVGMDSGSRPE
jgi:hypothetical protein